MSEVKILSKSLRAFSLAAFSFLLLMTNCFLLPSAEAHKFHTSLMVLENNSDEKLVEVSIQLFTDDLERVLETRHHKRISLDKSSETDKLIFDYLNENIKLNDSDDKPLKINWVGKEFEVDKIYVYLEIPSGESLEGKKMQNSIFFETFDEQTNIVIYKFGQKKADLLFKVGDKFKEIQVGSHKG